MTKIENILMFTDCRKISGSVGNLNFEISFAKSNRGQLNREIGEHTCIPDLIGIRSVSSNLCLFKVMVCLSFYEGPRSWQI